jgi:tetratricopeptide (TPR) repeat protein
MKKYFIYYVLIVLAFFTSCEDLLERTPEETISDEGVITNQTAAERALNGAYDAASLSEAHGIVAWNIAADNVVSFQNSASIVSHLQATFGAADRTDGYSYNYYYRAINRANSVIGGINSLSDDAFTGSNKQNLLAQAYFLRGLAYIELTKTFGAVPIVTKPSTATNQIGIKQSPRADVFQQALNDLEEAEGLFADEAISDRGRASKWAIYALKARLYLYIENWEKAEEYAAKVIANTATFNLTATPEGFFNTKKSNESIFEFPFSNADKLPFYTYYLPSTVGGLQDYIITPEFVDKLNDPAVGGNRSQFVLTTVAGKFVGEYGKTDGSSSIFVLRLAEQYLIRAEARLKKSTPDVNGAIDDINTIKDRATVALLAKPTTLTNEQLLLVIEDERRYELAFEGHRYFDIIRTGRAPQVFGPHEPRYLDAKFWVHPFPYSVVTSDPDLEQNEAYR